MSESEDEAFKEVDTLAPIAKKLARANTGSNSKEVILYNVPDELRNVKEDAYCHRVRTKDPEKPDRLKITECVDVVHVLATKLKIRRGCSGERAQDQVSNITEFMSPSGCFILELFLRFDRYYLNNKKLEDKSDNGIFKYAWMIPAFRRDLALLENQIPFFVLEELYDFIKPHIKGNAPNSGH
ncbi:hypothetical protein ACLB2K_056850 [Fragaria x ananassa]